MRHAVVGLEDDGDPVAGARQLRGSILAAESEREANLALRALRTVKKSTTHFHEYT